LGHDGAVVVAKMADVIKWFGETLGK